MRKSEAGRPISELRLPGFLITLRDWLNMEASSSLTVVLPDDPVTPRRIREGKRARQAAAAL
jgi:hypothetical protein